MKKFFYPENVVVIGVSEAPQNLGRMIVNHLIEKGFTGRIHAVGPRGGSVFGLPIHDRLNKIGSPLDLAVIITPALTVPAVLAECGRAGIRRVVIESAGFTEFAGEREDLERQLLDTAEKFDIRFIGPNCVGIVNTENALATPFVLAKTPFGKGNVSIVSQSGGVGLSYMDFLSFNAVYFNKVVSVGNKLNVDESDLLAYLVDEDQGTKIICMYLEGIKDGRRLIEIARNSTKPIIIHKAGVGSAGVATAASHTAALSSDDKVVSAAFEQAGIIRVHTMAAMMDLVKILQLPPMKGRHLAIVSRSGGHAVIAADTAEHFGFELPPLPPEELSKIRQFVRGGVINLRNPLDLGDLFDLSVYETIARDILSNEKIDGMVLVHGYEEADKEASRHFLGRVRELSEKYQKPVALCLVIDDREAVYLKQNLGFPFFMSPEQGAWALSASCRIFNHRKKQKPSSPGPPRSDSKRAHPLIERAMVEKRNPSQAECFDMLRQYDIGVPEYRPVRSAAEASKAANEMGFPVVLKVDLSAITHKSDVGGVQLNLTGPEALETAFKEMKARMAGMPASGEAFSALVMKQAAGDGQEVMFGVKRDPTFGPTLLFGMGGVLAEIIDDVSIRVAPVDRDEIFEMIRQIRGFKVLAGARGRVPRDLDWLADNLLKLWRLALDFPEIGEIDLNPVMSYASGGLVLDARFIIKK